MSVKKTLKQHFGNAEKKIDVLYSSSKIVFLILTLTFFILYYCLSSRFYENILSIFFLPVYLSFLAALTLYICAFMIKFGHGKIPKIVIMILCSLCIALSGVFIFPVL